MFGFPSLVSRRFASSTRSSASSAVLHAISGPSFVPRAACASHRDAAARRARPAPRQNPARRSSHTSPSRLTIAAGRDQRRVAQRQIARGAHSLLKLAGHAAALALVIAVVRARRELVDQQLALASYKNLHAEQAFDAELRNDRRGQRFGARFKLSGHAGRQHAPRQNLIFMVIARGGISCAPRPRDCARPSR